jgi:hypothetical protein
MPSTVKVFWFVSSEKNVLPCPVCQATPVAPQPVSQLAGGAVFA